MKWNNRETKKKDKVIVTGKNGLGERMKMGESGDWHFIETHTIGSFEPSSIDIRMNSDQTNSESFLNMVRTFREA